MRNDNEGEQNNIEDHHGGNATNNELPLQGDQVIPGIKRYLKI